MVDFATVVAGEEILEEHINQFASWLNGNDSQYYAVASIIANDATAYAISLRNIGTGGLGLKITDSSGTVPLLTVGDAGLIVGSTTVSLPDGALATPGLRFTNDTSVGFYRAGSTWGALTSNSVARINWSSVGVGFNGQTPLAPPDYTVTNGSVDRALNVTGDTTAQVAAVLGTLITDLIAAGLLT